MSQHTRILIIEDNEEVRENLEEILDLYGYETKTAKDGLEGIKAALSFHPDLIICDVMMPQLDGYGVLNILSKNQQTATTPFIFLTAKSEKADVRRGMNLGADDYITKPFYKDELLAVIETRLKKAAHAQQASGGGSTGPFNDPEVGLTKLKDVVREEGRLHVYQKKEYLVREGDSARYLYLVEEGHVHCRRSHEYGKDYILVDLGPEDLFGYASLLEKSPFPYGVVAASNDCKCYQLPALRFFEMINEDRNVSSAVLHLMAGVLLSQNERLVNQAYDSVRRRTALVLCDLYEKHGGAPLIIPREDLAQMVGTTKESVIRALTDFKTSGLLEIKGSKITIPNADPLKNLSV